MATVVLAAAGCGPRVSEPTPGVGTGGIDDPWRTAPPNSQPAWTARVNPDGWQLSALAPPLVHDGIVYTVAGQLAAAFRASDGTVVWKAQTTDSTWLRNTAALLHHNGRIYGAGSYAVALDARSGRVLWARRAASAASPYDTYQRAAAAVDDRYLYVASREHRALALDASTGAAAWETDLMPQCQQLCVQMGIALAGDTVYVSGENWRYQIGGQRTITLAALDRRTGAILWQWESDPRDPCQCSPYGRPLVAGRLLVLSDFGGGGVLAFDRFDRTVRWRTRLPTGAFGPMNTPAIADGTLYVGDGAGWIYALDLATGAIGWRRRVGGGIYNVVVCGDNVASSNFEAAVLDRRDGSWRRFYPARPQLFDAPLGTDGRRVYVQTTQYLVAMDC